MAIAEDIAQWWRACLGNMALGSGQKEGEEEEEDSFRPVIPVLRG